MVVPRSSLNVSFTLDVCGQETVGGGFDVVHGSRYYRRFGEMMMARS